MTHQDGEGSMTDTKDKYFREGYEAASRGERFSDACPYSFNKTGLSHSDEDQWKFDVEWRPKMDAWFAGWKAWLDERGLGFDFKPIRCKRAKP